MSLANWLEALSATAAENLRNRARRLAALTNPSVAVAAAELGPLYRREKLP